jgi:hypothetical protein
MSIHLYTYTYRILSASDPWEWIIANSIYTYIYNIGIIWYILQTLRRSDLYLVSNLVMKWYIKVYIYIPAAYCEPRVGIIANSDNFLTSITSDNFFIGISEELAVKVVIIAINVVNILQCIDCFVLYWLIWIICQTVWMTLIYILKI